MRGGAGWRGGGDDQTVSTNSRETAPFQQQAQRTGGCELQQSRVPAARREEVGTTSANFSISIRVDLFFYIVTFVFNGTGSPFTVQVII